MRPLGVLLRSESPLNLASEAVWRARRSWRQWRVNFALQAANCQVRFRPLSYFRFRPELLRRAARDTIVAAAELASNGVFPILGHGVFDLGIPPQWNRDFVSGKDWPRWPSTQIAVIGKDGSDIKVPWELSRLQFLPVLAKGYRLTGKERYRKAVKTLIDDWIRENPVGTGVNWTSAMEAALRGISICLCMDLLWPELENDRLWTGKVSRCLWQHLLYVEAHLELSHFARGNHYLSNLLGLLCLSSFLAGPGMPGRRIAYRRHIDREIAQQTYADGGDHEASTGYHVLVMQMFTCALLLMRAEGTTPTPKFLARLRRMYLFAGSLADEEGRIPQVGDCDNGRVEWLLDDLEQMVSPPITGRDTLRVASLLGTGSALLGERLPGHLLPGSFDDAAWYGLAPPTGASTGAGGKALPQNRVFLQSGVAIAGNENWKLLFFAMPNGSQGKGAHTHNDKLSFVLRCQGRELFSDSGTHSYSRDAATRNRFRSTVAHNTILVDGEEQNSIRAGQLFSLGNEAEVTPIVERRVSEGLILAASHLGYRKKKVTHHREIALTGTTVTIQDILEGEGEHDFVLGLHVAPPWRVDVPFHQGQFLTCCFTGPETVRAEISSSVSLGVAVESVPISRSYGTSLSGVRLQVRGRATLPLTITTSISCLPAAAARAV